MEVYDVGFLMGVSLVEARIILGGDKVSGSVLSGGSFEYDCYGKLEVLRPEEGDPLGVS